MRNIEYLRSILTYDPVSGHLYWTAAAQRITGGKRCRPATRAGSLNRNGYVTVRVDGRSVPAHQVAWAIMQGEWPPHVIDHIDRNRANNAWSNLRPATLSENSANRNGWGKSGYKGVYEDRGRFRAIISKSGTKYSLGVFDSAEEAYAVYCRKAQELYGQFALVAP